MDSFHSLKVETSSEEFGSNRIDKFNSQSNETSMSSPELSASPPSSCLVEFRVPLFPTSYVWTFSSVFMAYFGIFFDGPG